MWRRLRQLIIGLYAVSLLGCVCLVGGPALNDYTIAKDPGRALATVTGVGVLRTTVEYQDEAGIYHSPEEGLLYPTGLAAGQRVWVDYARQDPTVVKVSGRGWTLSLIPAFSVLVVATVVAAGLWFGVNAVEDHRGSRQGSCRAGHRTREGTDARGDRR